jgi:quinol-cytochrome oxidoreductase complex cytochrome b subunit
LPGARFGRLLMILVAIIVVIGLLLSATYTPPAS